MAAISDLRIGRNRRQPAAPSSTQPWLEALICPAALIDGDGTIQHTNEAWLATPESTPAGYNFLQYCPLTFRSLPETGAALCEGIRAVLARREPSFTIEYPAETAGRAHGLRTTITPYACAGFQGVLILHQEIAPDPATASALETDRRQAQKMETVGRLVGGVAHDFANLLTLITGYSELLLNRGSQSEQTPNELEEIRKAAARGARLTAQLLDFSRGKALQPRLLDLNAVLAEVLLMLRPIIGEHVELESHLEPALGPILADQGQIEQVIMNLVLNARDSMPSGGTIAVATAAYTPDENEARLRGIRPTPGVMLTVSDTGTGIEESIMPRLFQPFFTTRPQGRGTGLGLSTVQSIVCQNQGGVWATSAPGQGSRFSAWLPNAALPRDLAPDLTLHCAPAPSGNETILLVEDEEAVRRLLKQLLTRRGYTVLDAASGSEALEIFDRESARIPLLLTDLVMPRMNGLELARTIRERQPDIAVVFMSGYPDDVLSTAGATTPGMAFLQKPLRPDMLAAAIREALDGTRHPDDKAH